jgi:hypothetical protein
MQRIAKMIVAATLLVSATLIGISPIYAANDVQNAKVVPTKKNHQQLIQDTLELAAQGKTINSENFGINSKGSDIRKEWGDPGSDDLFLLYHERDILFELNNEDRVVSIHSGIERFRGITVEEVKKIAGEPEEEIVGECATYLDYTAGKYHLEFTFHYESRTWAISVYER